MLKYLLATLLLLWYGGSAKAEEYFVILFSHDSVKPNPVYSHTWATFVKYDEGVKKEFTISWMPVQQWQMFQGKVPGKNKTFQTSLDEPLNDTEIPRIVHRWGPYQISAEFFKKAEVRYETLNKYYMYRALDSQKTRTDIKHPATNCIHAVSDIIPGLNTGLKYGERATQAVVDYFAAHKVIKQEEKTSINAKKVLEELQLDKHTQIRCKD